jgi:EpsD family peptidyl-prolyl cis-trans isomerase
MEFFSMRILKPGPGVTLSGRCFWVSLITALSLAACGRGSDSGQVVAKVNSSEISVHQVESIMQRQPELVEQWGEETGQKVLQGLVEQELAAQGARELKLDSKPGVIQAMELAKREVLARAYQDHLSDQIVMPDAREIERYYDQHPELFKERRQYTILETTLQARGPQLALLRDLISATSNLDELQAVLKAHEVSSNSHEMVQWAENLPLNLLKQFLTLEPGHSVVVERSDGLVVGTLLRSEPAIINRHDAQAPIQAVLVNLRRREAVAKGMKALKASAKVELFGRFAPAASAVQAASAASK